MPSSICVYCSSSDAVAADYVQAAEELGREIGARGMSLVYGGTSVGLMGRVARAAQANGAPVVGVIPESIESRGLAFAGCDELIVTRDLRDRKAVMEDRADAFIALPGGFGTLEEVLEVLTLKQLQLHSKPIVLLNIAGFYDPLLAFFERLFEDRFAKPESCVYYYAAPDVTSAFEYLNGYAPPKPVAKWFAPIPD